MFAKLNCLVNYKFLIKYLNFRRNEKSSSTNKLQFISFDCVLLKEMIQKFNTEIKRLMVQFKTLLNFN